jgi:exodeoxyribonuclease VII small subunit
MSKSDKAVAITASPYMDHYKILADAAQELRDQDVVDIDKLVPIVDKALVAYAACKARIDAVEALLNERLDKLEE